MTVDPVNGENVVSKVAQTRNFRANPAPAAPKLSAKSVAKPAEASDFARIPGYQYRQIFLQKKSSFKYFSRHWKIIYSDISG